MKIKIDDYVNKVRAFGNKILESNNLVYINKSKYYQFLQSLKSQPQNCSATLISSDVFATKNLIDFVSLNLFFGTVNYCFINPYTNYEYCFISNSGEKVLRTKGLFEALANSPLRWNYVKDIDDVSLEHWYKIFQTSDEDKLYDLHNRIKRIKKFSEYLIGCGIYDLKDFFTDSISVNDVFDLLISSNLFEDQFYKRAQVTIKFINDAYKMANKPELGGIEKLTLMVDYRLPQLFYNLGIIEFIDKDLGDKIQNNGIIRPNSDEEVSIRAATIVLGQRLAKDLGISESDVDSLLWKLSEQFVEDKKYKLPPIHVPTDKY